MAASQRDRISVDLQGLKAPLLAQAQAQGVSPSVLVRRALASWLADSRLNSRTTGLPGLIANLTAGRVRLSLRLNPDQARALRRAAHQAGLSTGAYIAGLAAGVPVLVNGARRPEYLAALVAWNTEMSTLTRNIHHLSDLLRHGHVRAAQEYRELLDTLSGDVRGHLAQASRVLVDLRPWPRGPGSTSESSD